LEQGAWSVELGAWSVELGAGCEEYGAESDGSEGDERSWRRNTNGRASPRGCCSFMIGF